MADVGLFLGPIAVKCSPHRLSRAEFYHPQAYLHPGKMRPEIVSWLIQHYQPARGRWVLDPMCGAGTTLVEAMRLGWPALGVELTKRWYPVAEESCRLVAGGNFRVFRGDFRFMEFHPELYDIGLVLFSPPFGPTSHSAGHAPKQLALVAAKGLHDGQEYDDTEEGQLGDPKQFDYPGFLGGMQRVITRASAALTSGYFVVHAKNFVRGGCEVDLVGDLRAILSLYLTEVGHHTIAVRQSFFRECQAIKNPQAPRITCEYVLVFKKEGPGDRRQPAKKAT